MAGKVFFSPHPEGHDGLGLVCYAQVTSPLRRAVDVINLEMLVAAIEGMPPPYSFKELEEISEALNAVSDQTVVIYVQEARSNRDQRAKAAITSGKFHRLSNEELLRATVLVGRSKEAWPDELRWEWQDRIDLKMLSNRMLARLLTSHEAGPDWIAIHQRIIDALVLSRSEVQSVFNFVSPLVQVERLDINARVVDEDGAARHSCEVVVTTPRGEFREMAHGPSAKAAERRALGKVLPQVLGINHIPRTRSGRGFDPDAMIQQLVAERPTWRLRMELETTDEGFRAKVGVRRSDGPTVGSGWSHGATQREAVQGASHVLLLRLGFLVPLRSDGTHTGNAAVERAESSLKASGWTLHEGSVRNVNHKQKPVSYRMTATNPSGETIEFVGRGKTAKQARTDASAHVMEHLFQEATDVIQVETTGPAPTLSAS